MKDILKNVQSLFKCCKVMKIMPKMKNKSYRYEINRPRPRHGHKYTK